MYLQIEEPGWTKEPCTPLRVYFFPPSPARLLSPSSCLCGGFFPPFPPLKEIPLGQSRVLPSSPSLAVSSSLPLATHFVASPLQPCCWPPWGPRGEKQGGGQAQPLNTPRLFRGCWQLSVSAPKSFQAEGGGECPNPLFLCLFLQIPSCNKFPPVLCWGLPCATGVTSPISFPQHSLLPRDGNGDGFSKATVEQDGVTRSLRSHPAPWDPFGGGCRDPTRASSNSPSSKCLLSAKRHRPGIRFKRRGKAGLWTAVKC